MKVTIFQQDIVWDNPKQNVAKANQAIDSNACSDLYVLPEMFSTGFATEPKGIAETDDSETLHWMVQKAKKTGAAVCGSVAVESEGRFYNRFYFAKPDGEVVKYDKHHLFTYSGEDKKFTAGAERVIVRYNGWRILLQVCYDLRFPVFSRNRKDYDAAIYVASWPTSRVAVWKTLLRARALENQCYIIGVNRVGTDPYCEYSGGSAIIDSYGRTLAECEDGKEQAATATMDKESLEAFRKKFPVLDDADDFIFKTE